MKRIIFFFSRLIYAKPQNDPESTLDLTLGFIAAYFSLIVLIFLYPLMIFFELNKNLALISILPSVVYVFRFKKELLASNILEDHIKFNALLKIVLATGILIILVLLGMSWAIFIDSYFK